MRLARAASTHAHLVVLVVLLSGGWLVLENRGSALALRAVASAREVRCVYRAQLTHLPHDASLVRVWIPLAKTGREQRILRRDVHASVPYTVAQDPDYGNDILHVTFAPPIPEQVEITVEYRARLFGAEAAFTEPSPIPDELQRSLQPSGLVIIDEDVRARARQATAGRLTRVAQARGMYDQVRQVMAYDKTVPGWGRGDTRRACLLGKGNCTDFHSLFISMALAERIPARFKIGVVIPREPSGIIPGYHCWAEFYEPERGLGSLDPP